MGMVHVLLAYCYCLISFLHIFFQWTNIEGFPAMPRLRLDFILYHFPEAHSNEIHSAGVINNSHTTVMSDHYPVQFSWK